jgi:hypothetical protein
MHRQPNLLEIVCALRSPRRFPSRLDRWEQERNQNRDDRDYDKQLDEGETPT